MAELLFWPVLLLYGEAAVGYFGDARHPGAAGRAATWGVRLGWLVQTALLVLAYTLYRLELSGKRLDTRLRELRRAYA